MWVCVCCCCCDFFCVVVFFRSALNDEKKKTNVDHMAVVHKVKRQYNCISDKCINVISVVKIKITSPKVIAFFTWDFDLDSDSATLFVLTYYALKLRYHILITQSLSLHSTATYDFRQMTTPISTEKKSWFCWWCAMDDIVKLLLMSGYFEHYERYQLCY